MTRATFTIAAIALLSSAAAATSPPVTFESPCECRDNHGEHRWAVKNDPSTPPVDASAIQAVTPSDVFSWPGPAEHLTQSSERSGIENNWFALTGRVVAVKVEMDGDLHVALADATGDSRVSSSVKYRRSSNGVLFAKRFSVGRQRDSRFTLALTEN
jgi:hypothetical protein